MHLKQIDLRRLTLGLTQLENLALEFFGVILPESPPSQAVVARFDSPEHLAAFSRTLVCFTRVAP